MDTRPETQWSSNHSKNCVQRARARACVCVCVCVCVCAWVFCNWGWVRWMNSPFGVVKRKLSFVPNKVLWERICHFLFQLWFGNAGGNLLGEAFFGVEIEMLFIKKKHRTFPIYIIDICSCKTRESRETLNRLYCTWCCCCQIKLDAALWDLGGRSVFLPFSRKFG